MKKSIACVAAGMAMSVRVLACGPDFPTALLDDRASTLTRLPDGMFANFTAHFVRAPAKPFAANEQAEWFYVPGKHVTREEVERQWLGKDYDRAQDLRAQSDAATAYALGEGLPEDARRYLAGAAAFGHDDAEEAARRFGSVAQLPPADRRHYEVWSLFMAGRSLAASRPRDAMQAFAAVRDRVAAGAEDPLGLALDSYGEEARLRLDAREVPAAVRLYAEQAAQGSHFGEASLADVALRLLHDPQTLHEAVHDALTRTLLAVYLRTRGDGSASAFADALEQATIEDGDGIAQLAVFAYQTGRYELAGRLAARSHEGQAAWVRAKLAMRAGDAAKASADYAQAVKAFPMQGPLHDYARTGDEEDYCRVQGEAGTLALARSEYAAAMEYLYVAAPVYAADAAFVAERVLTIAELKAFVDRHAAEAKHMNFGADSATIRDYDARPYAATLARRLLREGRWGEAPAYFDDPVLRTKALGYVEARKASMSGGAIERAQGWFRAAVIARRDGMELLGYDYDPDFSVTGGEFENVYAFGHGPSLQEPPYQRPPTLMKLSFDPGPTPGERERAESTKATPDKRFHYRYLAADFAARAADLVPQRSQAYAALLCKATGWLAVRDLPAATEYYRRYVAHGPHVDWAVSFGSHCEMPDFAAAAKRLDAERIAAAKRFVRRSVPFVLGGGLAILVAVSWWYRRKAKTHT